MYIFVLATARSAPAQIVNTLSGFSEVPGWSGVAEATFAQSGGNTEVFTLGTAGKVQWQRPVRPDAESRPTRRQSQRRHLSRRVRLYEFRNETTECES
jgi:hypothetical protein